MSDRDIKAHLEQVYNVEVSPELISRVTSELKNRVVEDILIACMDGLTGFPDAVRAVFPQTYVQLCIVHIYSAPSEDTARAALDEFGKIWNGKYPMIQQSWETHWNDLCEFYKYPPEIRKAIYTTNAIESLNY
ncbi:MAG: hypothetical protein Ta2G_15770 [Termitinemataceae bacterium]|nr:MAG: hypothetical protein Ta2G_15770 [Termitinemataceae bacterium]